MSIINQLRDSCRDFMQKYGHELIETEFGILHKWEFELLKHYNAINFDGEDWRINKEYPVNEQLSRDGSYNVVDMDGDMEALISNANGVSVRTAYYPKNFYIILKTLHEIQEELSLNEKQLKNQYEV